MFWEGSASISTFFQGFLVFFGRKSEKIHFSTSPSRETGFLTPQEGLRASKITWECGKNCFESGLPRFSQVFKVF